MDTGHDIREARERAGLTQSQLGALVGVSLRTIGNWERGTTVPLNRLSKLREVLAGYWADEASAPEADALQSASDVELLAEIARRFARSREEQGNDSSSFDSQAEGTPGEADQGEKTPAPPLDRLGYDLAAMSGERALDREDEAAQQRGEEPQD